MARIDEADGTPPAAAGHSSPEPFDHPDWIFELKHEGFRSIATSMAINVAIEQERRRMLKDDSPLIDGSEAEPGLYDKGQTIGAVTKVSKSPRGTLLLYQFIREFRPQLVVELGTNVGISAAYQAAALNENANGGRLVTLEASPCRLRLAKSLHAKLGLENITYVQGLFSDTLQAALAEHGQVDLAYIDGPPSVSASARLLRRVVAVLRSDCHLRVR